MVEFKYKKLRYKMKSKKKRYPNIVKEKKKLSIISLIE